MAAITLVYIWGICLTLFGLMLTVFGFIFIRQGIAYKHAKEKLLKVAEDKVRKEHNKIAALPPNELMSFLSKVYANLLELEFQARISNNDPSADRKLYAAASVAFMDYLGPETVDAIEYYYGKDYLNKWTRYSFRLLESKGIVASIINKEAYHNTIADNML